MAMLNNQMVCSLFGGCRVFWLVASCGNRLIPATVKKSGIAPWTNWNMACEETQQLPFHCREPGLNSFKWLATVYSYRNVMKCCTFRLAPSFGNTARMQTDHTWIMLSPHFLRFSLKPMSSAKLWLPSCKLTLICKSHHLVQWFSQL